jgi:hypothetical protein
MTDKLVKELKRRKPTTKNPKFPNTRKTYKDIIKTIAKKYGRPKWLVENTIREMGFSYTLQTLEQSPPRKRSIIDRLKRLWFRKR